MNPTNSAAPRTRAVLLVVLPVLLGLYGDIKYGHTVGFLYFGAGFVVALMVGSAIGAVAERRDRRRVGL
jgi:hypothetical protein